ncbi:MAG TPA: maleylpyruvate isomerase N-terminal domain-containing protein [Propionibacteriaceae bacterium]|nr:maleylpyruvate isomerase N-terminal domain-containing protein [Propionibacteriaceae bacterium]
MRAAIAAERTELDGLSTAQWDAPSRCEGWRVREVMAHITMAFRGAQLLLAVCGCQIGLSTAARCQVTWLALTCRDARSQGSRLGRACRRGGAVQLIEPAPPQAVGRRSQGFSTYRSIT